MNRKLTLTRLGWLAFLLVSLLTLRSAWADAPPPVPTVAKPVAGVDMSTFRAIPIQDSGRYKPIDTVARESVMAVTGKEQFQGWDPAELIVSWMVYPEYWRTQPMIEIRNEALKKAIKLNVSDRYFTMDDLVKNVDLGTLIRTVSEKQRTEEKLTDLDKAANNLSNQMETFFGLSSGQSMTIIPHPTSTTEKWISLADLAAENPDLKGYSKEDFLPTITALQQFMRTYHDGDATAFNEATVALASALQKMPKVAGIYPDAPHMALEVEYNRLHPFRWSWILYVAAFISLLLFAGSTNKTTYWAGMCVYATALGMTVYGFFLRCMIAGRPPVTNMYESVIWVSFGATMFAFIFEMIYKVRRFAIAASAVGTIGFILADNLPNVLVSSIGPLAPVLRSNYWLTIHVLTITLSYAAFFLTWGLGHQALWFYLRTPWRKDIIAPLARYIYKAMQVGVLLVAAGTILGGVWANYSWGRFWGWDPKEVWALIVLLAYLVILHGRYAGYLKDFGTTVCSVVCFLTVIMAWYGVNFVLGVGLHSYGFGTGGSQYMMSFVGLDLGFVAFVSMRYKRWLADGRKSGPALDSKEEEAINKDSERNPL